MVRVITQEIDIEEYPIIARKHKTYYIKTYFSFLHKNGNPN